MCGQSDRKMLSDLKSVFIIECSTIMGEQKSPCSSSQHKSNMPLVAINALLFKYISILFARKEIIVVNHCRQFCLTVQPIRFVLPTVMCLNGVFTTVNWMPEKFWIRSLFVSSNGNQLFCMKKFNFPISFQVFPSACGLKRPLSSDPRMKDRIKRKPSPK